MSIAIEVLSILETAHAHGVIHRDIKPDNIFIVLLATPAFVAPEQAWDRVDARSDIYSLGATMWRLVCEHGMHRASTVQELLKVAATAPVRPIRELLPDLHSPIARVIDKALAFDPNTRWPSARCMREALEDIDETDREPTTQRWRRSPRLDRDAHLCHLAQRRGDRVAEGA